MGKTYKHGYNKIKRSFKYIENFKPGKDDSCRKRKHDLKNYCKSIINECKYLESINMSVKKMSPKDNSMGKPYKIGYCANSSDSFSDIKNRIIINYFENNCNNIDCNLFLKIKTKKNK